MCRVVRSLESFEDVTELSTVSREVKTSKESNVVLFEGGTDTWNDENINRVSNNRNCTREFQMLTVPENRTRFYRFCTRIPYTVNRIVLSQRI